MQTQNPPQTLLRSQLRVSAEPSNYDIYPEAHFEVSLQHELADILENQAVSPRFQIIMDLQNNQILGFEALIRGPSRSPLHSPIRLFQAAAEHGLSMAMESLCRRAILEQYHALGLPGKLFMNVSPDCLLEGGIDLNETLHFASELGISPDRIVIELTECQPTHDYGLLVQAVRHYRELGVQIAIDDLGEGFSSLRLWSELKPDYVKIDMHFIQGVDKDPVKAQFIRSIQSIAHQSSSKVIAEGIETQAELLAIESLGVAFGQGYFIARPHPAPTCTISAEVMQCLAPRLRRRVAASQPSSGCIGEIMQCPITVSSKTLSCDVENLFLQNEKLKVIPIIDQGQPIGIINRHTMVDRFARPYQRELYGRKPCTVFMEKDLIIVDHQTGLEKLSLTILAADPDQLMNGILITRDNQYLGMASGADLLRALTKMQIEAARHANPLTQLPGNVPINQKIDQWLNEQKSFVACYCDLDHFKPFNDVYGYQMGDEVIELTGRILSQNINVNCDFLGHIGGDDFVILFQNAKWEACCEAILAQFGNAIQNFYSHEDRERGGYLAENRQGKKVFHALISLSIGAVTIEKGLFQSHHQVSVAMADAKKQAKKSFGNSLFVDRRLRAT